MRASIGITLFFMAGSAFAQVADQCAAFRASRTVPGASAVLMPVAAELAAPMHQLGAPSGVLEQAFDEALAVDQVLLRMKLEKCMLAHAVPGRTPGMPASTDPAAYKPKTEFDNTPWRFDMNQNGKRMTAVEFDAWMKSRGVRVARGAGAPAPPPAEPVTPEPQRD